MARNRNNKNKQPAKAGPPARTPAPEPAAPKNQQPAAAAPQATSVRAEPVTAPGSEHEQKLRATLISRLQSRVTGSATLIASIIALFVLWITVIEPIAKRYFKLESELTRKRDALRETEAEIKAQSEEQSEINKSIGKLGQARHEVNNLQQEFSEYKVGIPIPGLGETKVPLIVAPVVWSSVLVGLLVALAAAKSSIIRLAAQATRLQLNEERKHSPELLGEIPWWCAPLPSTSSRFSSTTPAMLLSAIGWERNHRIKIALVLISLVLLVAVQARVCWLGIRLSHSLTDRTAVSSPGARQHRQEQHRTNRRIADEENNGNPDVSNDRSQRGSILDRSNIDLGAIEIKQDILLVKCGANALLTFLFLASVGVALYWLRPDVVRDRFNQEVGDPQASRRDFMTLGVLSGAAVFLLAIFRPTGYGIASNPRFVQRRKSKRTTTNLTIGFHENPRSKILHWVNSHGVVRIGGPKKSNLSADVSVPKGIQDRKSLPRVHLASASDALTAEAERMIKENNIDEASRLLQVAIEHDRVFSRAAGKRPAFHLYDKLAKLSVLHDRTDDLSYVKEQIKQWQTFDEHTKLFIDSRLAKWDSKASKWYRRTKSSKVGEIKPGVLM